jgi:tetratricopeptide (TPR) repeat protein
VGACVTTAVIATVLLGFVNDAFDLRDRFFGDDKAKAQVLAEAKANYEAGYDALEQGTLGVAETYFLNALSGYRDADDRQGEADTRIALGHTYLRRDDFDKAEENYDEALVMHRKSKDRIGEAGALYNLGRTYARKLVLEADEEGLGEVRFQEALRIYKEENDRSGEGDTLFELGGLYDRLEDTTKAVEHYTGASGVFRDISNLPGEAAAFFQLGLIHQDPNYPATYDLAQAEQSFVEALAAYRLGRDAFGEAEALSRLGFLAYDGFDDTNAATLLGQALAIYERLGVDDAWVDDVRATVQELSASPIVRP